MVFGRMETFRTVVFPLVLPLVLMTSFGCSTIEKAPVQLSRDNGTEAIGLKDDPDSNLNHKKRGFERAIAAQSDERDSYLHNGPHNFHPGTVHGTKAIDTKDSEIFQKDLSNFKEPKAVSDNYEYQTNREDIVARHTFVLAGADRRLGHHVALFESRHQHHAIVKLDFDFTGTGLKKGVVKPSDLKAGKELFENAILQEGIAGAPTLKKGEAYAVQVSQLNPEFELVTIPTGITRMFLGSLAVIDENTQVTRFNQKGSDVVVRITDVHHFSRIYLKESPTELQYMAFSANTSTNRSRYVFAHVIQGSLPKQGQDGSLNKEQLVEVDVLEPAGFVIKEGSVMKFESRPIDSLLKENESVEATFHRDGSDEEADTRDLPKLKLSVRRILYTRPLGLDPAQAMMRKRVRGS